MPKPLVDDDCLVWHIPLDVPTHDLSHFKASLSPTELERYHAYRHAEDKRRFCITRAYLRRILADYSHCEPKDVQFLYTDYKKPYIEDNIEFNVSHSATDAVIALSRHPIGIDIETYKPAPQALQIAKRFFTPNELHTLKMLPEEKRHIAFYHIWTQKEAIVKALGKGVFHDLKHVEVSAEPPAKILHLDQEPTSSPNWTLFSVPIPRPHTFCMCAVNSNVKKPVMMAI